MSHLKKLSDRLRKNAPSVLQLVTIENLGSSLLEMYAEKQVSITKGLKEYYVPSLLLSACHYGLGSLSAPQVNLNIAGFVMHKDLVLNKWGGYTGGPDYYKVYINPQIIWVNDPILPGLEECPSVPYLTATIHRHQKIKIEYLSMDGEYIEEELEGFNARVFMHENDHLEGMLISSFSVNSGEIQVKNPEKYPKLYRVLNESKRKLEEHIRVLEDRCLIDEKFRKKVEKLEDRREFFISEIVNEEYDAEYHIGLVDAMSHT